MRQIRGLLRESVGKDAAKWRKGGEAIENGSSVDTDEESLPPFFTTRDTGSLLERHVPGCKL